MSLAWSTGCAVGCVERGRRVEWQRPGLPSSQAGAGFTGTSLTTRVLAPRYPTCRLAPSQHRKEVLGDQGARSESPECVGA